MLLATGASSSSSSSSSRRRPLTPCSLTMGALCWVLPQEEDGEVLQEEEVEQEAFGWVERLLEEVTCCRSCRHPADVLLNVDRSYSLYQTFPECRVPNIDVPQNPDAPEAGLQSPCAQEAGLQSPCAQGAGLKNPYVLEAGRQRTSPAHLSVCQRLHKVIEELVETERSYVKDLLCLFDLYLSPLQKEAFLSREERELLFGSLPQMLDFQKVFLQTLEQTVASCPNVSSWNSPEEFQRLLLLLGGAFLRYADHFKLYSGFCVDHVKLQKLLERAKSDGAFRHFLESRNPTNQHSASLESFLIKPVQRVLKYPLLLRELLEATPPNSPQHTLLAEALQAMQKVATHINEMQKIYEEFGGVFDQLTAEQSGRGQQVTEISMGELLLRSSALWLNPLPCVGRLRKEPELTLFVFRRAVVLIYRDFSRLRKRMAASPPADRDAFRFRWVIPGSAVRVRPAFITGSGDPCVWELIHSRSEEEGRPETVFQLCSSGLETKACVLRALRSLLVERANHTSLRTRRTSTCRRRRRRQQRLLQVEHRAASHSHASSSYASSSCSSSSWTTGLEVQLQRLHFSKEEEPLRRRSRGEEEPLRRRSRGEEEPLRRRSRGEEVSDLSGLLGRDFSIQSLSSIFNEECFYDGTKPAPKSKLRLEDSQQEHFPS